MDQERFLIELLKDFRIEASEHYQAIVEGLITLENEGDVSMQQSSIETIFREVHSLKGASRAVNLLDIEKLCSSLENIFNSLKKGESEINLSLVDTFHKATDLLNVLLSDVNQNQKGGSNYRLGQILKDLEFAHRQSYKPKIGPLNTEPPVESARIIENASSAVPPKQSVVEPGSAEGEVKTNHHRTTSLKENQTVRISTDKLNSLLRQSEELISIKSTFEYHTKELQRINYQYTSWNEKLNGNIAGMHHTHLSNVADDFLAGDKNFRKKHEEDLSHLIRKMVQFQHVASRMVDELLYDVKTVLLFPFSSVLSLFPKIVRDLSKEYSKDIDILIVGDSIEIDRRILEEMKDPLIHLIRNCIDHGIEPEKVRIAKGKPAKGRIEIRIDQDVDRKIELKIKDDGAGIDKEKVINAACKLGILQPEEAAKLSEKEVNSLIFQSGISSSPFITDISGRGLGMAIVAEKVVKLGGSIEVETIKNSGTTFVISLPQTLSTFRGVLIKSEEQYFILPSISVERAVRIQYSDIKTVGSRQTISYKNETIGLALLSDVLKITSLNKKRSKDDYLQILILNISQKRIAFVVDEILGEQEGIVKELGLQLPHVNQIAGATILGSGKLVLILHPPELIDAAAQVQSTLVPKSQNTLQTEDIQQKRILVAEDSITIRTLLRNFIESAGFVVKTAVDGLDAYQLVKNEEFDLVVADIEIPRMNGFELTAKIRDDQKHADLPVILVTALETAEDKQRGMEVGANAYIVKSSFEKSNLIETIQRLI